jgi:F0F1-type ATP synthase membrane subunit c/vacuolar-type H+-ATPase subunit K
VDGPDLSHLLDDANSERPSKDVLDGIIRRRRRLQARRARTAATLGLVIALAGAGVGIGLSRRGGTTLSALPRQPTHAPSISKNMSTMAPVAASPGSAPEGLGWVSSGSGAPTSTRVPTPRPVAWAPQAVRSQAACRQRALCPRRARLYAARGTARCTRPTLRPARFGYSGSSLALATASASVRSPQCGPRHHSSSSRPHRDRQRPNRAPRFPNSPRDRCP